MKYGKINLIAGSFGLILAALGGVALGATFDQNSIQEGNHLLSEVRFYLREGHSHGMPMALLNLIYALWIDKLNIGEKLKRTGSIAITLTYLLPIGLFAKGVAGAPANFPPIGLIGILGFLIGAGILALGSLKTKE